MKSMTKALLVAALLAVGAGCAGTERQPECHGPWTPINTVPQVPAHG